LAVEGAHDDAVARRLCELTGHAVVLSHVTRGKPSLDKKLLGYNNAARFAWWLVLRDLDHDADCAPSLVERMLPIRSEQLVMRVPVRSVEAWLLADLDNIGRYLGVSRDVIPHEPEQVDRPKRALVDLARRSSRREIRDDMVPAEGLSVEVGAGYTRRVLEFVNRHWDPFAASAQSDSLRRCLAALQAVA
jgi:hypothetical protein